MVKPNQKPRVGKGRKPGKTKTPRQKYLSTLDANARAYARLIIDPCRAPLAYPTYSGGEGGYLVRVESFITVGTGAGETCGMVHWVPGFKNTNNTDFLFISNSNPDAANVGMNAGMYGPGASFLLSNAASARCVAACMKAFYGGSESSRSGKVHIGNTNGGFINAVAGVSRTVNGVCGALQNYGRTPPEGVECIWKPASGDQLYINPAVSENVAVRDQKGAITCAWTGLPAAVGLTIHMTAVYEWQPTSAGIGVTNDTTSRNHSNATLDTVLNAIIGAGETFVRWNAMGSPAMGILGAAYGLMGSYKNQIGKAF